VHTPWRCLHHSLVAGGELGKSQPAPYVDRRSDPREPTITLRSWSDKTFPRPRLLLIERVFEFRARRFFSPSGTCTVTGRALHLTGGVVVHGHPASQTATRTSKPGLGCPAVVTIGRPTQTITCRGAWADRSFTGTNCAVIAPRLRIGPAFNRGRPLHGSAWLLGASHRGGTCTITQPP